MPIDKPLQDVGDLTIAMQALVDDLNRLWKKMDAGPLKDEAAGLSKRAEVMIKETKHLGQAIAFTRHDRDVQRDGG
jgi:hypothetical protein